MVSSIQCRSQTQKSLGSVITTNGVRILVWSPHPLIFLALMMIRHILLYPQKFKYHLIMLLYRRRLWALNALQGLEVLSSKHWVLILNHEFSVAYHIFAHENTIISATLIWTTIGALFTLFVWMHFRPPRCRIYLRQGFERLPRV